MIRHLAATATVALSTGLLSACSGSAISTEKPPTEHSTSSESPSVLLKAATLVDQLMAGDYDAVMVNFDATMAAAMPKATLTATINAVLEQMGPFQERTDTRQAEEGAYDVVYVTTVFEKGTLNTKVVYDDAGKVSGLFFLPQ